MSTTLIDLDRLEAEYLRKRAEIRSDDTLSWEKKERRIRELGLAYDRERREAEGGG